MGCAVYPLLRNGEGRGSARMSGVRTLPALVCENPVCPQNTVCTVAFSGGADSTALLLVLHELAEQRQIDLRAVHVHHGIRGAEADRDADFCKALCARRGIPFQTVYVDVPAYAKQHRLSAETAARILRYEALENAAPEGVIATAHHAGDNAETVLFHLMRGSGLRGLRGILPENGRIIRPLLYAEKTEILAYLAEQGQIFQQDSTNASDESSRNRIRHTLIPLLTAENPAFLQHIGRTAAMLTEDEALLTAQAQEAMKSCLEPVRGGLRGLAAYPKPLRMRVYMMRLAALPVHIDPSYELLHAIDALLLQQNGKYTVSRDVYAEAWRGILYIRAVQPMSDAAVLLRTGRNRVVSGTVCDAILTDPAALSRNLHKADTLSTLDFDRINGSPYFRQWRGTDQIELPGRGFSAKLKTCIQAAVPAPERRMLHVLYDDSGCIYCEAVGIAARVKPDANSRRILLLQIHAADDTTEKE